MSAHAEINRQRRRARPLYLELRALGLELRVEETPEDPSGYAVEVEGLRSLSPAHADRVRARVEENAPDLIRVLWLPWDEDLEAVRKEGAA